MKLRQTIPPYAEPLHIDPVILHLRLPTRDEDSLVNDLIATARQECEEYTRRQLLAATWELKLDSFPGNNGAIELPRPPLVSVASITYKDTAGATQTLSAASYVVDNVSEPGRVSPAYGYYWPSVYGEANAVTITYVAGHAAPVTANATTDIITLQGRTVTAGERMRLTNSGGALPGGLAPYTDYFARDISGATCKLAATSAGTAINISDAGTGLHYLSTGAPIPWGLLQGMLLCIGDLYENRESHVIGTTNSELDILKRLWRRHKVWYI